MYRNRAITKIDQHKKAKSAAAKIKDGRKAKKMFAAASKQRIALQ